MNSEIFHRRGVALSGYDVVAYHEEKRAKKGNPAIGYAFYGLEWHFSKKSHRDLFAANPERYLPRFGGFCAFGAAQGYKAPSQPNAFYLQDGKLYFNFAKYVQRRWLEDKEAKIRKAEAQWHITRSKKPISAHPIPIWWKYQLLKLLGKDLFR